MSSHHTVKPTGEARMRHVMDPSDPNVNLLERILSRDNVQQAWKRVKANKGALGIDKMSMDDFPEFARTHWVKDQGLVSVKELWVNIHYPATAR